MFLLIACRVFHCVLGGSYLGMYGHMATETCRQPHAADPVFPVQNVNHVEGYQALLHMVAKETLL